MHLYICIIAPHLGTIDEPREGRDIRTEHEDDVWWTYLEEAKKTRSTCLDQNTRQASVI